MIIIHSKGQHKAGVPYPSRTEGGSLAQISVQHLLRIWPFGGDTAVTQTALDLACGGRGWVGSQHFKF